MSDTRRKGSWRPEDHRYAERRRGCAVYGFLYDDWKPQTTKFLQRDGCGKPPGYDPFWGNWTARLASRGTR